MSNAKINANVERNAECVSESRSSKVRQLIQMFEQLTICGRQSGPFTTMRSDLPVQSSSPATKALTLLVNGRRVAQTIPHQYQHKSVQRVKGLDASS